MADPNHDYSKHPDNSLLDKLESHESKKPHGLSARLHSKLAHGLDKFQDLKIGVGHFINPNERHDEEDEIDRDRQLMEIRKGHRFTSFAPEREGNVCTHHIDGASFFHALSVLIDSAKSEIFILGWWVSPELYLRRPPAENEEWRLDRLLQRKAEEGVRIYISVYKEASNIMTLGSLHTKHALEALHPRIKVMRHPQHVLGEVQYFYSHHEKLVVVDCRSATIGGLDLCFGRWDDRDHVLADCHPTEWRKTGFPGQDFNNARLMDFQTVDRFTSNALSVAESGRMPWHDTSMMITGPSVVDMCQHFIERWNFIKACKYERHAKYEWLALPEPLETIEAPSRAAKARERAERQVEHPHMAKWAEAGRKFAHPFHWPPSQAPRAMETVPEGEARVQVIRSVGDWSHGVDPLERSIQDAYIQLITEANHTIYIENQFFITSTTGEGAVNNTVGRAIAQRIISAARDNRPFRVIIIIPALPAFPGDIQAATALHAILQAQYNSIDRGPTSICQMVKDAGYDPEKYISWWNLRTYDRINFPAEEIRRMEQNSGVTFHQAQVAQARIWYGPEDLPHTEQTVTIQVPQGETGAVTETARKQKATEEVKMPTTLREAQETIRRFEAGRSKEDKNVADNVAQHVFGNAKTLAQEEWNGTPAEELTSYISELVYIHCKLMIVDSRRVIVGSANMNERSLNGARDSEIAVVIEDMEMMDTVMGGEKYRASGFAAGWQRGLMREHLGLEAAPAEIVDPRATTSERAHDSDSLHHPSASTYDFGSPADKLVEDMLSDEFWNLWHGTAQVNTEVYEKVFRPIPTDHIRDWTTYKTYLAPTIGIKPGHVADPNLKLEEVKELLSKVKGHLVPMAREFMCDVEDMKRGDDISMNAYTLPLYM